MSIPPTSPVNIGLLDALNRLGVKGSSLPELAGGVQPVMVIADLSRSVASELVEARRIASDRIAAGGLGTWSNYILHARSPGGLVVESLVVVLETSGFAQPVCFWEVGPRAVAGISGQVADIGGAAGVGFTRIDYEAGPIVSQNAFFCLNPISAAVPPTEFWTAFPSRIFVPAGSALTLSHELANLDLRVEIVWRELADIQGAP